MFNWQHICINIPTFLRKCSHGCVFTAESVPLQGAAKRRRKKCEQGVRGSWQQWEFILLHFVWMYSSDDSSYNIYYFHNILYGTSLLSKSWCEYENKFGLTDWNSTSKTFMFVLMAIWEKEFDTRLITNVPYFIGSPLNVWPLTYINPPI